MNKSEIFKAAHKRVRDEFNLNVCSYREAFAECLSDAYYEAKKEAKVRTIGEVKESFWASWKGIKAARYSNVPGQLSFWQNAFNNACDELAAFGEDAIRNNFGKFADFAMSKVA